MNNSRQRTIKKEVSYEGTGLFSGAKVKLSFKPAPPDTGIVFLRSDLPKHPRIPATIETLAPSYRRTALNKDGVTIETVEHLLSALAGLGLDNLEIELNGSEIPSADGSAQPFVEALSRAGFQDQPAPKKCFTPKRPIALNEGNISLVALPAEDNQLTITYTLEYNEPLIGTQHLSIKINERNFIKELASARTFCLASEVDHFLKQGLGKGASYQNTLVIDKDKIIQNQLRFKNEFVRHKILDLLGDLYLVNARLSAHIIAVKSGHEQNIKFVRKISEAIIESQTGLAPRTKAWLDVRELQKVLPHRYPFLLIDKVIEIEGYNRIVGIKNVTINEPFFQGHFPDQPIMPGVLQIEAMAQLAGALLLRRAGNENKLAVLFAIDKVKLRKSVVPGDQLRIEAETIRVKTRTGEVYTRALVEGELAAEAYIKFMLIDAR